MTQDGLTANLTLNMSNYNNVPQLQKPEGAISVLELATQFMPFLESVDPTSLLGLPGGDSSEFELTIPSEPQSQTDPDDDSLPGFTLGEQDE